MLWKAYFDKGWAITNYFKYVFAFAGIFDVISLNIALIIGFFYIIFCFLLGFIIYNFGIIDIENEIQNIFNPFQREVRDKLNGKI